MTRRPTQAEIDAAWDVIQRAREPKRYTPAQVAVMTQEQVADALNEDPRAFDHIEDEQVPA